MDYQTAIPSVISTGNDGLGGGLVGGLLLGSLLRGGNLLNGGYGGYGMDGYRGNYNGGYCSPDGIVTPSLLASSFGNATDTAMNTTVLQTLGDIKASVPLAEGQVQLALAGAQADINANVNNSTQSINANIATGLQTAIQGQAGINKNISEAIASSLASQGAIKETILTTGAANLQATTQAKFELAQIVKDDGEKTRSLITANQIAELNRIAQERQDEIIELRNMQARERDRHGIEISMVNNQNQNQLQLQAQAQVLGALSNRMFDIDQLARATNQQLIIGNTGVATGGPQTSNPTNVRA